MPSTFEEEWEDFSKGYRNRSAENIAAGLLPTAWSDKLSFENYNFLTAYAVKSTFYAHSFLVLGWNLMARSGMRLLIAENMYSYCILI